MDNIYFMMIIALAILAVGDLVVGVSNDAVNFLNSAIGSKAIPFKTILIVASTGIAVGAIFSGGMMEVARNGIFNPGEFVFSEIMIIFMAVMITDILLLDFFNSLGMPTSTTVSIVFELLGAAVAVALIKIGADSGDFSLLGQYINTSKASEIVSSIFLSVLLAFSVGAVVQYVSRLLLTFNYQTKAKWIGAVFGALALTSITFFVLIKGLKGSAVLSDTVSAFINTQGALINIGSFVFWFLVCYILAGIKYNIYKLVIIAGTFSLALAFAGNDLVNFIGVPIAAWQSYEAWQASGIDPAVFSMEVLSSKVPTPTLLLFIAGIVMVLTLWFSKKARHVTQTEINLSREGEAKEKFQPNFLSRSIVRGAVGLSASINSLLPAAAVTYMDSRFKKHVIALPKEKTFELPAFDMVRAAVNLMVAGILISIATSFKLPLSTTYVTFMVAMGSSLADRAWGAESAVYRVAGVLNVIGGWFITALIAFVAASVIAYLINLGGPAAIAILLFLAVLILVRNYISHNKKSKEIRAEDSLRRAESSSIQGVIAESAKNISNVVKRSNKLYLNTVEGLAKQDLNLLLKNKKGVVKLSSEIDDLRDHIFYFIKNLDDTSVAASNFYINTLGYLQDMAQSLEYLTKISHKHIHNNHKKLKYNQIKELKELEQKIVVLFAKTKQAFDTHSFEEIGLILANKQELFDLVSQKIEKQIARTRTEESSPKNTTLYFTFLTETKDLISAVINLLDLYYSEHDSSVQPAKIDTK
ncbi:inorganic phosphate transporter [Arenibacter sp. GZD96]|uniref:inorganic phosphate transporter n=1 Tax=Aurantibrevibacter litoralis TaxID=3106030 RepID=UPI002AFFFCA5|nr:inorganic phosphate transporter [Arenibacter sp. GZD-96]MEA1787604.1 inorganic phosphate transporter [Arenibacter sp. GZD-96]